MWRAEHTRRYALNLIPTAFGGDGKNSDAKFDFLLVVVPKCLPLGTLNTQPIRYNIGVLKKGLLLLGWFLIAQCLPQVETRVYSVYAAPGNWFTHSGANYAFFPFSHQWNWYYGHVQRDGVVGIRTDYPRSGNGKELAASNRRFWQNPINGGNFFDAQPLSVWQSSDGYQPRDGNRVGVRYNGDSVVCGISIGAGTGWNGSFIGAVDNIILRFRNGVQIHFNFEVRPTGDVNGDGLVDDADSLQILMVFGNTCSSYCPYDLNRDNAIDDADLLLVLMNFGAGV